MHTLDSKGTKKGCHLLFYLIKHWYKRELGIIITKMYKRSHMYEYRMTNYMFLLTTMVVTFYAISNWPCTPYAWSANINMLNSSQQECLSVKTILYNIDIFLQLYWLLCRVHIGNKIPFECLLFFSMNHSHKQWTMHCFKIR